jgi:hypothetical protein
LAETSGDEEDKPGEEDESSSQISSVGTHLSHPRSCPTFHERTSPISQVSTIHLPSSEVSNIDPCLKCFSLSLSLSPPPPPGILQIIKNTYKIEFMELGWHYWQK